MSLSSYAVFFTSSSSALTNDGAMIEGLVDFFPNNPKLTATNFFELDDWSFGVEHTVSPVSGAPTGRIVFDSVTLIRRPDNQEENFLVLSAQGTEFTYVDVIVQSVTNEKGTTFLGYRFGTVAILAIGPSFNGGNPAPAERLTLAYGSLDIGYAVQNSSGSYNAPTFKGWNRITNKQI